MFEIAEQLNNEPFLNVIVEAATTTQFVFHYIIEQTIKVNEKLTQLECESDRKDSQILLRSIRD